MTCCSSFVVIFFLCKNAPVVVKQAWNEKLSFENEKNSSVLRIFILNYKVLKCILYVLWNIEILYYICYIIFSILGTIIHPFFFVFHLTEILFRYHTLKNVMKSVYIPRA